MEKGINELMIEARKNIVGVINQEIQEGIPPACACMLLESILRDLEKVTSTVIEQEKEHFAKEAQKGKKEVK